MCDSTYDTIIMNNSHDPKNDDGLALYYDVMKKNMDGIILFMILPPPSFWCH